MSAKKTAFSDVKNLLGTNTPALASKSGLKKPVFGSQFKSGSNACKAGPSETKGAAPSRALHSRNYKPRIDLSAIDYSDNEPHLACKPSGQRDILFDFWSASGKFEIYKDFEPVAKKEALPEISFLDDFPSVPSRMHEMPPVPNLFDDIPPLSFSSISFDDL